MDAAAPEYARIITAHRQAAAEQRAVREAHARAARTAARAERRRERTPAAIPPRLGFRWLSLPGWPRTRPSG